MDGRGILPPPARGRDPLEEWEGASGIRTLQILLLVFKIS